jgi:stage II sporulation protein D
MALVQAFPGPRPVQRKSRRPWRCARRLAAAGTVATMLVAGSAWSAQAADTYPRPADGVFSITGHGNGHGHGMSQYGALGAARAGLAWQDIIDFYYPGTTQGTIGNSTIKVRVAGLGSAVEAYPASGLSITWNQTDVFPLTTTKDGKTIARWRMAPLR